MTEQIFDVVVAGAGPAGLQAAMHAVRKKASVLVVGRLDRSSLYRAHIENYLCVDGVKDGSELLEIGLGQIKRFGAEVMAEDLLSIEQADDYFEVLMESGGKIAARSLILATGTTRRKLKVKGERELVGKGVSYCVDCDANFYRKCKVAVVGNESAAVHGAMTLLGYAAEVILIASKLSVTDDLRQKLKKSMVQLREGTWVKEIMGTTVVEGLCLENGDILNVEGVFVELGAKGAVELAANIGVALDMETFSHILTDKKQATNVRGVYAAGDITGYPYQMAKAVGEGCVAGWEAANYVRGKKQEK